MVRLQRLTRLELAILVAQAIRTTYPFGPTQPYLSLSSALLGQSNLAFQIQVEDFASVMTSQLRLTTTNE